MQTITTLTALEALYGTAAGASISKEVPALTPAYRAWIEAAPFFAIATAGPGGLDCSPRGDPAGHLIHVGDERTVLIPDRRGNNRLDTLRNIIADPRVALLFLVPGVNECLRINGRAAITDDEAMRRRFASAGKLPATVIVVSIDRVYFQCARALLRASLWQPREPDAAGTVPTAGQMLDAAVAGFDGAAYDAGLAERQAATLY